MKQYSFEKLEVWKLTKAFTVKLYNVTKEFPDTEKFGLVSQLRRAAISISSNLAEGSSRKWAKDQGRFYVMAFSSSVEVMNQLIISNELKFIDNDKYKELRTELELITAMLNSLHKSTHKRLN